MAMCQGRLDREDFEDSKKPGAWTKEGCERTIANAHAAIERAGKYIGFPAYESVAIFFDSEPTEEELDLMWERAKKFCDPNTATAEFRRTQALEVKSLELIRWERKVEIVQAQVATRS